MSDGSAQSESCWQVCTQLSFRHPYEQPQVASPMPPQAPNAGGDDCPSAHVPASLSARQMLTPATIEGTQVAPWPQSPFTTQAWRHSSPPSGTGMQANPRRQLSELSTRLTPWLQVPLAVPDAVHASASVA